MRKSSGPADKTIKKAAKTLPIKSFPIVGFGASAGGLEAFTNVLRFLNPNLGMAYVLIMHLSPTHKSNLTEILQSKTKMPVRTVKNGMELKANNIFVIPPNSFVSVTDGHLKLSPRGVRNFAIDYFLTGLASLYKNNAIGIILSGTATDGTLGLKAIKAEGGITFAQDESAEFSSMPRSAFDAGYVDLRLSPARIAKELAGLAKMPYTILPPDKIEVKHGKEVKGGVEELKKILQLVKNKSGVDFFLHYKHASIYRRVVRRMVLNKFDRLQDYYSLLKASPKEVDALYDDFLINVTNFFRDQDFFKILVQEVFPAFVRHPKQDNPIRVWVAGCSTGEEAYSIAICLLDFLEKVELVLPVQIFASDLDINAIEKARIGVYPLGALQGVSQSQLGKYFRVHDGQYQVVRSVREICVFSHHNLLKDPPFSRMDLISCQNVLIYLETNAQKRTLQTFHYALKPAGYLVLGKSETVGSSQELFEQGAKKDRYYLRKSTGAVQLDFIERRPARGISKERHHVDLPADLNLEKDMNKIMLTRYVHPAIVVNRALRIIQFFGVTGPYLAPGMGKASFNVLKMIREDLSIDLMTLLQHARTSEKPTMKEGIRIINDKVPSQVTIEVFPKRTSGDLFFLIVFKETIDVQPPANGKSKGTTDQKSKTIARLEDELVQSRGLVRSTSEEYETTYEELQANNEEILSSNEELQSVNEELETSKEELQSSNEELTTTNEELSKRNQEISESQNELKKVNEQLEQFAFISSHDLQEPLRKIEIFSDFLSGPEANLNDYAKKYAGKINASALRMSTLLKDLLSFSVLNVGYGKKSVKVNLNEIIRNVLEDFEVIVERSKATINLTSLPTIYGEPVQMNQLFHNLISNALKFSKESPVIYIASRQVTGEDYLRSAELKSEKQYVVITVSDNGIGFDQKYATKVFSLFQRLNDRKDVVGTGIGLSICKKIVENHNGVILADGKENEGATFTIFLPAP